MACTVSYLLVSSTKLLDTSRYETKKSNRIIRGGGGAGVRHGLRSRFPYPVGKLIFRKYQERLHTRGGQITKGQVKKAWRDKFKQELAYANKYRLRIATQYLSGYATVNYHLHKYRPDIPKLCAYCGDEDETV